MPELNPCLICGEPTHNHICDRCKREEQEERDRIAREIELDKLREEHKK